MLSSFQMQEYQPSKDSQSLVSKKRIIKQKKVYELESSLIQKTQEVIYSPYFNKYESTNSTSNVDDDEIRNISNEKEHLRLKLKRNFQYNDEDEYSAIICLISLKKRQRTSEGDQQLVKKEKKSHKPDQIKIEEVKDQNNETTNQENESIIIKLPSLSQHKQLQQAIAQPPIQIQSTQSSIPTFFPTQFSQVQTNPLFYQIDQNPNIQEQGLQQYLQFSNLLLK